MNPKAFFKTIITFLFVVQLSFCFNYTSHAQSKERVKFSEEFSPFLANDRIVIKLHNQIDPANFQLKDGKLITGFQSLDQVNSRFLVKNMSQLFPDSKTSDPALDIGLPRIYVIEFSTSPDIQEVVKAYANNPDVEYAQPVGIHRVHGVTPSDPNYYRQWGMSKVKSSEAWEITKGDTSVLLAIVDTGVDWKHPDLGGSSPYLKGNIWTNWIELNGTAGVDDDANGYVDDVRGWDWVNVTSSSFPPYAGEDGTIEDNDPMDFNGHGTHCAGIASAITDNSAGVAGLGWSCKIMPLRAGWSASYYGSEVGLVSMDFCAKAIYYAARNGAAAVNCSWGSSNSGGIGDAVTFAASLGTIVVTSAGNDDLPDASYLSSRSDCISVAATDPNDKRSSYSSFGFWVDVSAPGGDNPPETNKIYSTYYNHASNSHTYAWLNGTSMASPHVVGLIGLIHSQFPGITSPEVSARLRFTSDNIDNLNPGYRNGMLGQGRINAFNAITQSNLPSRSIIFSESFDNGLPSDWIADTEWRDNDPGNRNGNFDDSYMPGSLQVGYDIWTPPFMIVDSDYEGNINIDASLISPVIDCSKYSDISLIFDNWFQNSYSGNIEKGDVDFRIDGGAWQNAAQFIDYTYSVVDAGKDIVIRLTQSVDFQKNVQFRWRYYNANQQMFWGIDDVRLTGNLMTTDRFVQLSPASQSLTSQAGDTVTYHLNIMNLGQLSDRYRLKTTGNTWQTTTWDAAGTNLIDSTSILMNGEELDIMVKVAIPPTAANHENDIASIFAISKSDTNVFARAFLSTYVKPQPGTVPWFDDFPTTTIDTTKWTYNKGPVEINSIGSDEPSPPYALNFNGDAQGSDELWSEEIDLGNDSLAVMLSFYYQRTGGGESTETGDDLFVEYFNSSKSWITLKQFLGAGEDMTTFRYEEINLPADAYHSGFRIRFRNIAATGNYDDWFIDDVSFVHAPDIHVVHDPDPFDFTLDLGDSTTGSILIGNDGQGNLSFQIADFPAKKSLIIGNQSNFSAAQDILKANFAQSQQGSHENGFLDGSDRKSAGTGIPDMIDFSYSLDEMLKTRNQISEWLTLRACVVDGYGTDASSATTTWDYLNLNYRNFGATPIVIDYTSLNKENITYQDLENSGADVLIVSNNWGTSGSYLFSLTADECEAIARYTNEGHGLYISGGTFNNYDYRDTQPHVDYMAGLIGINLSQVYDWTGSIASSPVRFLQPAHPLFKNIADPYSCSYTGAVCVPIPGDWTTAVTSGTVLGISNDNKTAIIARENRVFHSGLPESGSYGIGNNDYQFLYNVITFAAVVEEASWLQFKPTTGIIVSDSMVSVTAKVRAHDLLPDSTYHRNVAITSNDPDAFENPFIIPASLRVYPADYYFRIAPIFQEASGKAEDTLDYFVTIKNHGLQTDSYKLDLIKNSWDVSFLDSTGQNTITITDPVPSDGSLKLIARVLIPFETQYGETDLATIRITSQGKTRLSRDITLGTKSLGKPASLPWFDNFAGQAIDTAKWISNVGPAEINETGIDEPSAPYALNLNAYSSGGDEVQSQLIDLSNDSLVILSYFYQRTGGGDSPESGDDLWVDFQNESGSWVNLANHLGDGEDMTEFQRIQVTLPAEAYHAAFRIRFRSKGSVGDDWFVDNISVAHPPIILVGPEKYDVKVAAGDSAMGIPPLTIRNNGEGDLFYRILTMRAGANPGSKLMLEPANRRYPESYYSPIENETDDRADARKGAELIYNSGGPDDFGYHWIDSDEPGGPAFNWIDISGVGTKISGMGTNNNVGFFPIGFIFPFYGNQFSMFRFCSNGFISFTSSSYDYSNDPIPNQSVFDLIAPFWDYLYFDSNSSAYYHNDGEKLIIQYNNVQKNYTSERNTFEILLYRDGTIVFQYLLMQSTASSATIGIQNSDGRDGLEVAFNTSYVHDSLAISIEAGVPWIMLEGPATGSLPQDSIATIPILFNAKYFINDTERYASIFVNSNDLNDSSIVIPVAMKVVTDQLISGTISSAGNVLAGAIAAAWNTYPEGTIIYQDTTDASGEYSLFVPPEGGIFDVRVYANGYFPSFRENIPGNTKHVNFTLQPIPEVTPTPGWIDFFSSDTRFWGGPVQAGDIIIAEDPDSVVCGVFAVANPGNYGFLPVYQDDETTTGVDEGAEPGDVIRFKINGYRAETLGPDDPAWTSHGSILNVDLHVEEIDTVRIFLTSGWNLISWNVVPTVDSTHLLLADILPKIYVVLGYEKGGLTYDPMRPSMSNLLVMDNLHGYWIKMKEDGLLEIIGNPVKFEQTPINCEAGWNLVGFLPEDPDSTSHAFSTVLDHTVRAYGFKQAGFTFDPNMAGFNTLNVVAPSFGYWIYLTQQDTLAYPEPLPGVTCPYNDYTPLLLATSSTQERLDVTPTNEWINLFGDEIHLDGELLPIGTVVRAIDPNGVCCGLHVVSNPGNFGFMPIYCDDPGTDVDEGAKPGDQISIYFNDFALPVRIEWKQFGDIIDLGSLITAVSGELNTLPEVFDLSHNYPNPFNPHTSITYQLPEPAYVTLKIYNMMGQVVRTLIAEEKKAGYFTIAWDGKDRWGNVVANGIYLYQLKAGQFERTLKMIMLK